MELYFLRHGIAAQRGSPKYKDDSLRPLIPQGRKKMRQIALGMQALGLKFDVIFSSPYVRARQTAEIVAQAYNLKKSEIHFTKNLLPPASIKELLKEIRTHYPKAGNILLVGHEPHLTEMVSSLLNSEQPLVIELKKGGLCHLSTTDRSAVLHSLLTPSQLSQLAKH